MVFKFPNLVFNYIYALIILKLSYCFLEDFTLYSIGKWDFDNNILDSSRNLNNATNNGV